MDAEPGSYLNCGHPHLLRLFLLHVVVEAIAEAADAADQEGIGRSAFDLLAQAQNVDVDGAVGHRAVVAPHGIEQLFAAEDHAGPAHQEFQQPEFGGGKRNFVAVQTHLAAGAVEFEIADFQKLRTRRLCRGNGS